MEILRKDSITGFRVASDEYSEPSRTSKLELFSKIVNGWKPLTIFAESFILDVRLGSEYVSEHYAFSFFFFFLKNRIKVLNTVWKVSICGVFLIRIFPQSDWIRRHTDYFSVFSANAGKYRTEKLRIRTLFTQCKVLVFSNLCKKHCQIKFWK